ncbi:unnamed protein product [Orchesella dallaii]|uniref:Spt4/RpoE2 zinc finger domain-containing protein n=1 Tax=Orchesella dallaii TaxID=48710 RepID=A0ABP1S2E9_9HEXA
MGRRGRGTKAGRGATKKTNEAASGKNTGGTEQADSSGGSRGPRRTNVATLPSDPSKNLRACMICSLIKSEAEFENEGCDNCERWLKLAGIRGSLNSYTSKNFEGMIAMIEPHNSWVAKWQRIAHLKPGVYAVNVRGEVERWVKEELKQVGDPGVRYFSRDKTKPTNPNGARRRKSRGRNREDSGDSGLMDEESDNVSTVGDRSGGVSAQEEGVQYGRTATVDEEDEEPEDQDEDHLPPAGGRNEGSANDMTESTPYRSGRTFDADSSSDDDAGSVSSKSSG